MINQNFFRKPKITARSPGLTAFKPREEASNAPIPTAATLSPDFQSVSF